MGPKYAHGLEFSKGNPRPCRNHPNFCTLFSKVCKKFLCTHGFSHSKWDPHKNQTGATVCHHTLNLVQIPIYLAGATIAHILYYTSGIPFLTAVAMTSRRKKSSQDDTTSSVNATKMPSKKATTSISMLLKREMRSVIAVRCYDYIYSGPFMKQSQQIAELEKLYYGDATDKSVISQLSLFLKGSESQKTNPRPRRR